MSFIKDIPCPHCGANMCKVGFVDILCDGFELTDYSFKRGYLKTYITTEFLDHYIECNGCNKQLKVDPDTFLEQVELMWD